MAEPKPKRTSQSYAQEIADLLCRYEDTRALWRTQAEVWSEIRKRLAQYRLAKKREEKQSKRELWQTEKTRKIQSAKQRHNETRERQ